MKAIYAVLLALVLVLGVGCGEFKKGFEKGVERQKKAAQERAKASNPEPPKTEPKMEAKKPTPPKAFTNTLGMVFKPVPGTEVQFCIWETRVKDYAAFAAANAGVEWSVAVGLGQEKGNTPEEKRGGH